MTDVLVFRQSVVYEPSCTFFLHSSATSHSTILVQNKIYCQEWDFWRSQPRNKPDYPLVWTGRQVESLFCKLQLPSGKHLERSFYLRHPILVKFAGSIAYILPHSSWCSTSFRSFGTCKWLSGHSHRNSLKCFHFLKTDYREASVNNLTWIL